LLAVSFRYELSGYTLFFPFPFPPFIAPEGSGVVKARRVGVKGGGSVECEGPVAGTTLVLWQLLLMPLEFDKVASLAHSLADMALPHANMRVVNVLPTSSQVALNRKIINVGQMDDNDHIP
jgi:hypothetical protein